MKIWLISQNKNNDYDTYDSAVVCAATEEDARRIYPGDGGYEVRSDGKFYYKGWSSPTDTWAPNIEDVKVKYLGEAKVGMQSGVICASFNAG